VAERSTHLLLSTTGGTELHNGLEGIVDPPLETSKSTDHEDTSTKTLSHKVLNTDLASNLAEGLALVLSLSELRDERVGRVRDDSADDTGEVTGSEGDAELSSLGVGLLGLGEDVGVEHLDDLLEEEELGHGVGDLTRPERNDRAEGEASLGAHLPHLGGSRAESDGEGTLGRSLDLDLDHFHGAKSNVSEDLSRSGTSKVDQTTVVVSVLLTSQVRVEVLEVLVETELEHTLERVTNSSGSPTLPDGGTTLLSNDGLDGTQETLVLAGVDLHVALGDIERSDSPVSGTAGGDTCEHALGVVGVGVGHLVCVASIPLAFCCLSHNNSGLLSERLLDAAGNGEHG